MLEKIKITISKNALEKLESDCEKFIFLKTNSEINRNLFLNTLILNFHKSFNEEDDKTKKEIQNILNPYTKNDKAIDDILKYLINKDIDTLSSSTTIINIKPTKLSSNTIDYINNNLLTTSTISSYYRRLFENYTKYLQYKREQIICDPIYTKILSAISKKKKTYILLKNGKQIKETSIYTIKASTDELYNYVIFETQNGTPATLRLSKINSIELLNTKSEISKTNIQIFEKQIHYGIQYPLYSLDEEPVKVKFTNKGLTMFKKIYLHRPIPDKIEDNIYTFNCSHYQITYYFKRFGKEAIILSPKKLTKHLQYYYSESNEDYLEILENQILNEEMAIER